MSGKTRDEVRGEAWLDLWRPHRSGTVCREESMTRQSEMADADIGKILERFQVTGVIPVERREALFIDVSQIGDYQQVQAHILNAQEAFREMPAKVRAAFGNDPARFLDEACDPQFKEKFQELGILEADLSPGEAARAAEESALASGRAARSVQRKLDAEERAAKAAQEPPGAS